MKKQELVIADDEDSGLQKLKTGSSENQGTTYDYAQVLKEMQKELQKIPAKYPEEGESYQDSTERAAESNENLELNLVKTIEPKDNNEDTENIAYSESAKKDASEAEEAYDDEDFEKSEEKSESQRSEKGKVDIKSTNLKSGNNGNLDNKGLAKHQEIAKPPATDEEDNGEKYSSEGFEEEEVDQVPDLPEESATIEPIKQENIKKGPPAGLASTVKPKEAPKNRKPPQLAQTAPAKNFKVRNVPNNKEVKKDIPKLPPKEPKEVKKETKALQNETKKPLNPVRPPLKRPASATATSQTKKEKPKPKEDKKEDKDNDLNFEIEEHVQADQATNNPASERVIVPASKGLLASLKIERPKSQANPRKQGEKEEDISLSKTQQPTTGIRIRTVKKEPKDMLRQIFEGFKKKEEKIKEKDEKIFAVEETDKRVKSLTSISNQNKDKEQEVNWVGNGMGLTTDVAGAVKKRNAEEKPKKESGGVLDFAKGFLANLESKFKKVPKLGQEHEVKDENKETKEKGKQKEGKKDEKLEKTWKYEIGQGVNSEYLKTQKLKEEEYKKKFNELFKSEKTKQEKQKKENLQRVKEIMKKEKENQKNIQQNFVKDFRAKNAEKKEEREPKVLQIQNVYLEEEVRLKKEQQKEEIHQLKLKMKLLKQQNEGLKKDLAEIKRIDSDASRALDSLAAKKAVILLGKMDFTSLSSIPKVKDSSTTGSSQRTRPSYSETILSEGRDPHNLDKLTPIEIIINKFADQGLSLEQVYQLLDENEDNLLTTKEIKDGLKKLELELDNKDINYIVSVLDKNTDGTITLPEFIATLQESLNVRKEYKDIMGDLRNVNNPIVLEERMLDIATKKKLIEEDAKKVSSEMKVQEYEYKQLLKKLQEFERLAGPKDDKKVNLDTYRDNILSLKVRRSVFKK